MAYNNHKIDNEVDGGEPFLIRVISNIKGKIKNLEFSSDCFSQLLAMFEDGTVKVYHINQSNGKKIDKLRYANKEQLKYRSIFEMKEKIYMNYNFCLSDDEASNYLPGTNLKLTGANFHPSTTFTGTQHCYMLNCANGLIVKINTNFDHQNQQNSLNIFNGLLAPIIAPEDQQFPRGKDPFYKVKGQNRGLISGSERDTKKHINREFFTGHRYKILFMGFVDGGSTMVTIDIRGYLYIWVYDKSSFTAELYFKPTFKLKLELNFTTFIKESSVRIFPPGKEKEINPKTELKQPMLDKIERFMSEIDIPGIQDNSLITVRNDKDVTTHYFVPVGDVPEEYGVGVFIEYLFNSKGLCIRAAESKYQAQPIQSRINAVKMSKDKKYLIIHMIKEHIFSIKGREMHEFVVVRIMGQRLNTMKLVLDLEYNSHVVFELSNEIPPINLPYMFLANGITFMVASIITGQIVDIFDLQGYVKQQIRTSDAKRGLLFDQIV
jgi:hypothetical protein